MLTDFTVQLTIQGEKNENDPNEVKYNDIQNK